MKRGYNSIERLRGRLKLVKSRRMAREVTLRRSQPIEPDVQSLGPERLLFRAPIGPSSEF
jgi:hypothetical protein